MKKPVSFIRPPAVCHRGDVARAACNLPAALSKDRPWPLEASSRAKAMGWPLRSIAGDAWPAGLFQGRRENCRDVGLRRSSTSPRRSLLAKKGPTHHGSEPSAVTVKFGEIRAVP